MLLATALFIGLNGFTQTFRNTVDKADSVNRWLGISYIDSTVAHSGMYAAYTDSTHPYGLGVEMLFPPMVQNKNTVLTVKGYVYSRTAKPDVLYVVSIENNGETAFWKAIPLKNILSQKQTWTPFRDSVTIPADITKSGRLKIFLWNKGRKSRVLADDFTVSFKPLQTPSFLKDIDDLSGYVSLAKGEVLFKNSFYKIWNRAGDGFFITDTAGIPFINYIRYFFNEKHNQTTFKGFKLLHYTGSKYSADKIRFTFITQSKFEKVKLIMYCYKNSPQIDLTLSVRYKKTVTVKRSALLVNYAMPLQEVFRARRKSDTAGFQTEYWLDKQGFSWGNNSTAMAVYHDCDISSLQLNTKKHLAVINMDYYNDHPFLRFPLDTNAFDVKTDRSVSVCRKGRKVTKMFKIYAGIKPGYLPRFMKNPDGFLATYIWTEHADWGDVRTHRATFFGSEKIVNADSATGGFVKFNIPVTKSVFYDNPDSITNTTASDGLFNTLETAIKTDSAYADFLFQIYKKGNEICLHTPEQYTTTPNRLHEALKYMKNHFNSPVWIDHGYNNHKKNNREDFVCDGTVSYVSSLWRKYGIRYFWNPYYEDYQTFSGWGFFGSIEKMYWGFGDFYPKPDYWQHPAETNGFYHWPTASVLYIKSENLWNYFFSSHQFKVFTNAWGVEVNHCYPAWTKPGKGFWKFASDSTIVAMKGFDHTLAGMQKLMLKGVLNVTTVSQFLNYRLAAEKVQYKILPDGRVKVTNTSDHAINGLSFAVKAKAVLVNGLRPAQKKADSDLIFWFDLKAGQTALIRVIE